MLTRVRLVRLLLGWSGGSQKQLMGELTDEIVTREWLLLLVEVFLSDVVSERPKRRQRGKQRCRAQQKLASRRSG